MSHPLWDFLEKRRRRSPPQPQHTHQHHHNHRHAPTNQAPTTKPKVKSEIHVVQPQQPPPPAPIREDGKAPEVSSREHEDLMLAISLSIASKEQEDQQRAQFEYFESEKLEDLVVESDISLNAVNLADHAVHRALEGWLQFEDPRAGSLKLPNVPISHAEKTDPFTQALDLPSGEEIADIPLVPLPVLQTDIQTEEDTKVEETSSLVQDTSEGEPSKENKEILDCGDSSEDQYTLYEGTLSLSSSQSRGQKRKNEDEGVKEKRRKKTRTKIIKLQQELAEKTEKIKGLEDQVEESTKKYEEQNDRLSKLEGVLAERNNSEFGSTWCSVM